MRIVVDANIIIQALMGSHGISTIIRSQHHQLFAPERIIWEVEKKRDRICAGVECTNEEFELRFSALLKLTTIATYGDYAEHVGASREAMRQRDITDAEYVACALGVNADFIWTDDKDLTVQKLVPVKTTDQFIEERKGFRNA